MFAELRKCHLLVIKQFSPPILNELREQWRQVAFLSYSWIEAWL